MTEQNYRLYTLPSFFEGIGRIGDFSGVLNQFNYSKSPAEADQKAICSDWMKVGSDLKSAMNKFEKRSNKNDKKNKTGPKQVY